MPWDEFRCAMCSETYLLSWLAFAFTSDGHRFGVCETCAMEGMS